MNARTVLLVGGPHDGESWAVAEDQRHLKVERILHFAELPKGLDVHRQVGYYDAPAGTPLPGLIQRWRFSGWVSERRDVNE